MIRKAKAVWRGTGRAGAGHLSTDSGVLAETPYSWVGGAVLYGVPARYVFAVDIPSTNAVKTPTTSEEGLAYAAVIVPPE
jgi:hypothetical protein